MPVEVEIEDARWGALAPVAERAAAAALRHLGLEPSAFDIALLACGDARIAELNGRFRGKARPTNVLAWPAVQLSPPSEGARPAPPVTGTSADPAALGDIAIAYDTCAREAEEQGKTLADHAAHLVVHAVLHLLGYDHARRGDAHLMEATERAILAQMGIADPYDPQDGPADAGRT